MSGRLISKREKEKEIKMIGSFGFAVSGISGAFNEPLKKRHLLTNWLNSSLEIVLKGTLTTVGEYAVNTMKNNVLHSAYTMHN